MNVATPPPPALRALLADLRREIREQCPDLAVRIVYAPSQQFDAFVEVYLESEAVPPGTPPEPLEGRTTQLPVSPMAEARFHIDDTESYTVALMIHETSRPAGPYKL